MTPQPEHFWLVKAGLTTTTSRPAHVALKERMPRNAAQERRPARVRNGLGKVVVLQHIGRLQIFVIDRVVVLATGERRLVVKV
jgi:hypothetical protein